MFCVAPAPCLTRGYFAWVKAKLLSQIFFDFFLSKNFFKNVIEYSLPEATVGVKWECVWNEIILSNFQWIREFRN